MQTRSAPFIRAAARELGRRVPSPLAPLSGLKQLAAPTDMSGDGVVGFPLPYGNAMAVGELMIIQYNSYDC